MIRLNRFLPFKLAYATHRKGTHNHNLLFHEGDTREFEFDDVSEVVDILPQGREIPRKLMLLVYLLERKLNYCFRASDEA